MRIVKGELCFFLSLLFNKYNIIIVDFSAVRLEILDIKIMTNYIYSSAKETVNINIMQNIHELDTYHVPYSKTGENLPLMLKVCISSPKNL